MSTVFALLFIAALGLLIWGVCSPRSLAKFSKKPLTRGQAGIGFGVAAFILMMLSGATAPKSSQTTLTDTTKAAPISTQVEDQAKLPVIITSTVTETESVPFESTTASSSSLSKGVTKVTTSGVNGIKTLTYQITTTDGVQTDKKLVSSEVTTAPVTQVTTVGTYVKPTPKPVSTSSCDPNYSGACVPIASDVDCGGGSGNGPAYVYGTVRVIGTDIYGLDRDGDGYGCE